MGIILVGILQISVCPSVYPGVCRGMCSRVAPGKFPWVFSGVCPGMYPGTYSGCVLVFSVHFFCLLAEMLHFHQGSL